MRISKEAAAVNRSRVIEAATKLLREKGFEGLGVADVMKEAGFTHGGFYNHFESKNDLAAQAVRSAFDAAVARVAARAADAKTRSGRLKAFRDYVDRYLSKQVRDAPGDGCPIATLGTDAARHGDTLKAEFADGLQRYLAAFANVVPDAGDATASRQSAITAISTLIGALTLSRACAGVNDDLSEEILSVVRKALREA